MDAHITVVCPLCKGVHTYALEYIPDMETWTQFFICPERDQKFKAVLSKIAQSEENHNEF